MAYEPRGKVKQLLDTMGQTPDRVWSSADIAAVMEVPAGSLHAHLGSPVKYGLLHRRLDNGRTQWSLQPFPGDGAKPAELKVPTLARWTPPPMRAPREGSDVRLPSRAPGTPPAPAGVTPQACWPAPAPTAAPVNAPAVEADTEPQDEEAHEVEAVEPDAFISCRTGEIVLVGLEPDEEGRVTIPADLAAMIRRTGAEVREA